MKKDLLTVHDLSLTEIEMLLELSQPHVVLHLAAKVGGIGANRLKQPGDIPCGHRVPGFCFAVFPGIAEIWNYSSNF